MIAARLSPGAISESSSSHFPPSEASKVAKPVTFPLGRSSRSTMPLATLSTKYLLLLDNLQQRKSMPFHMPFQQLWQRGFNRHQPCVETFAPVQKTAADFP